jgi:H+-transporting ATPase
MTEVQASIVINRQINRMSTEIIRKSTEVGQDRSHIPSQDFTPSRGLTSDEANDLLKKWGRNELVEKSTPTWLVIFRLVF